MDIKRKRVCAAASAAIAAHYLITLHSTSMAVSLAAATITDKRVQRVASKLGLGAESNPFGVNPTPSRDSSESPNVDRK